VLWVQSIEKDQDSTWRFEAGKVFVKHSTTKETELGFYSLRKSIAIEEPKQIDIELKEAVNGKNL
jgi:hypothetical protein